MPPAEYENLYYQHAESAQAAWLKSNCLRQTQSGSAEFTPTYREGRPLRRMRPWNFQSTAEAEQPSESKDGVT